MELFKESYQKLTEHIKYPTALQKQYIIYFNGILMYSVINIYLYTGINVCKFAFNKYETMLATDQKVSELVLQHSENIYAYCIQHLVSDNHYNHYKIEKLLNTIFP